MCITNEVSALFTMLLANKHWKRTASSLDPKIYELFLKDKLSSLTHNHHLPLSHILCQPWASLRMRTILISTEANFTISEAIESIQTTMIRQEVVEEEARLIFHPIYRIKIIGPTVCLIVYRFALAFKTRYLDQLAKQSTDNRVPIDPQSSISPYFEEIITTNSSLRWSSSCRNWDVATSLSYNRPIGHRSSTLLSV